MYKISILIPFYNERGNIIRQLEDLIITITKNITKESMGRMLPICDLLLREKERLI